MTKLAMQVHHKTPFRHAMHDLCAASLPPPEPLRFQRHGRNEKLMLVMKSLPISSGRLCYSPAMSENAARPSRSYVMTHTDRERRRLALQASIINPFTDRFLRDAGIAGGMH